MPGRYDSDYLDRPRPRARRTSRDSMFPKDYRDNREGSLGRSEESYRRYRDASGRYGRDDWNDDLPHDETGRLIASNKVEGTPVYGRDGARLGTIYNFMVDKRSGRVDYAVMRYGGFLGIGQRYFPLPWDVLDYDVRAGGYVVDMVERDFEDAPSFGRDSEPDFDDRYGRHVYGWYGLNY